MQCTPDFIGKVYTDKTNANYDKQVILMRIKLSLILHFLIDVCI